MIFIWFCFAQLFSVYFSFVFFFLKKTFIWKWQRAHNCTLFLFHSLPVSFWLTRSRKKSIFFCLFFYFSHFFHCILLSIALYIFLTCLIRNWIIFGSRFNDYVSLLKVIFLDELNYYFMYPNLFSGELLCVFFSCRILCFYISCTSLIYEWLNFHPSIHIHMHFQIICVTLKSYLSIIWNWFIFLFMSINISMRFFKWEKKNQISFIFSIDMWQK